MNKVYLVKLKFCADYNDREETRVCKTLQKAKQVLRDMAVEECNNCEFDKLFCNDDLMFYAENEDFNITIEIIEKIIEE